MNIKTDIVTAHLFARHQNSEDDNLDDFFTFAGKYMAKRQMTYHYRATEQATILATPTSILNLIQTDVGVLRSTVEELIAASKLIFPGQLFYTDAIGFLEDLTQKRLRRVILSAISSSGKEIEPELRELCVRLFLRMGLIRASAEDLLLAA